MKRKLAVVFGSIAVLALFSTGTLAYFTAEAEADNVITAGNLDLKIHDRLGSGEIFPEEGIQIMPGQTVEKSVTVENTGGHPMYLRVKLVTGVKDADGREDELSPTAKECLNIAINEEAWTYREDDGYYYYADVLEAGETTPELFTEVVIDGPKVDNAYLGKTFTLNVDAYAVQSEHNGATVWEAFGWPEDPEEGSENQ